jgi:hypothetical protein
MKYRLVEIKDSSYVFDKEKADIIESALSSIGKNNYYIYHDRVCTNKTRDMEWCVCIIVLSEPDSDKNISADKLISQLESVGIETRFINNSQIELTNNENTFTVELPLPF